MNVRRRPLLKLAATAPLAAGALVSKPVPLSAQGAPKTYVLVHGAWHGGWCWRRVADRLRAAGHRVFTPTCTGLGERSHLLSEDITLDTFTQDIVNVIEFEELSEVILVGHSFGGMPISGTADRIPQRIRHLVYLDALILQAGQSPFSVLPSDVVAARTEAAQETSGGLSLPVPEPSAFAVTHPEDADWLERRLTPHPFNTYTSPLNIKRPVGNDLPRTYIACTDPYYAVLEATRNWVEEQQDWTWVEIATGHDAMVTAPDELTELLVGIA